MALHVTGPPVARNGAFPKIVATYADGLTVLLSPFGDDGRNVQNGGFGERDGPPPTPTVPAIKIKIKPDSGSFDGVLSVSHAPTSTLLSLAFAPPSASRRILSLTSFDPPSDPPALLFTAGTDCAPHLWALPSPSSTLDSPGGGPVALPRSPIGVLDVPKSVHELMSYSSVPPHVASAVSDHSLPSCLLPSHSSQKAATCLPPLACTALALNNHGTEIAVGAANGTVRIYDLTTAAGGKLLYTLDTAAAANSDASSSSAGNETMRTPPISVAALAFEEGTGSSRSSQFLAVQHNSGWACVANRSACFRGGEIVAACWPEEAWSYAPAEVGKPAAVAKLVGDGVDVFSVVNESRGGSGRSGRPRHCLVRRMCGSSTKDQRLSTVNRGTRGAWRNVAASEGDHHRRLEDWEKEEVLEGLGGVKRFKSDSTVVGADVHPSGQYVLLLSAKGTVFVYHLWLGELRGVFPTQVDRKSGGELFVRHLKVDPFGLYVAVGMGERKGAKGTDRGTDRRSIEPNNIYSEEAPEDAAAAEGTNENERGSERGSDGFVNRVEVFEITTGENAFQSEGARRAALGDLPLSSAFQWSSSGTQIVFIGGRGTVDVRALPAFMVANLSSFKKKLQTDSHFWSTFPLYVNVSPEEVADMGRSGSPLRGSVSRGTLSRNGGGGDGGGNTPSMSRQPSRAGFSPISEMSSSDAGTNGVESLAGIPRMGNDGGRMGEQLRVMNKDASKNSLFGRHSDSSSPTA